MKSEIRKGIHTVSSLRRKFAVIALSAVVVLGGGVVATRYASAAQVTKAEQLQQLEAQIQQEQAKLEAMTPPRPEDVGPAAYAKAAEANAAQGRKVKDLIIKAGKIQAELHADDPVAIKEQLDQEILGAYASFSDLAFFKSQDDADSKRAVQLIESRKAAVDKIVADYKAGVKTPKAALTEIQALFK